jgi:ABC-type Fe3+ transport system permease subunit
VLLLVSELRGRPAQISRWAISIFIVIYPAFDAAVGVASGIMVHTLSNLGPEQRSTMEAGLHPLFWGPVTGSMAIVGSASWLVALIAAAGAWRRAGAPRYAVAALALSGVLLGISHIRPFGPLACLFFLGGAAWVTFRGNSIAAKYS